MISEGLWCPGIREALRAGTYKTASSGFQDIDVGGFRVRVTAHVPSACP